MDERAVARIGIALDAEQEVRRDQHRLDRELNALLGGLPGRGRASARTEVGDAHERVHFPRCRRSAIGAPRQPRDDLLHAGTARRGVAGQDPAAAFFVGSRRMRSNENDRVEKLVLAAVVGGLVRERRHEFIADEASPKQMVAFGQRERQLFLGVRIEVDQARRFGLHGLRRQQRAVHPEAERDGRRVASVHRWPLAWQPEAHRVLAAKLDAVLSLDRAAIETANPAVAGAVVGFDWFGGNGRGHCPGRDPLGGREVTLHQQRRHREEIRHVVEAVAGIVGREVFLSAEANAEQVSDRVRVFVAIEAMGRHPTRIGRCSRVGAFECALDVGDHRRQLCRTRNSRGWHVSRAQALQHFVPCGTVLCKRSRRHHAGHVEAARCESIVVAVGARAFQHRQDEAVELVGLASDMGRLYHDQSKRDDDTADGK